MCTLEPRRGLGEKLGARRRRGRASSFERRHDLLAHMTAAPEIAWGLLVRAPETDAKFPEVLALCAPTTYVGRYPDRHRPFDAGADLVVLWHERVSRVHCVLRATVDGVELEYLGSNAMRINGDRLETHQRRQLVDRDRVAMLEPTKKHGALEYDYEAAMEANRDRLCRGLEASGRAKAKELKQLRVEIGDARDAGEKIERLRARELDALGRKRAAETKRRRVVETIDGLQERRRRSEEELQEVLDASRRRRLLEEEVRGLEEGQRSSDRDASASLREAKALREELARVRADGLLQLSLLVNVEKNRREEDDGSSHRDSSLFAAGPDDEEGDGSSPLPRSQPSEAKESQPRSTSLSPRSRPPDEDDLSVDADATRQILEEARKRASQSRRDGELAAALAAAPPTPPAADDDDGALISADGGADFSDDGGSEEDVAVEDEPPPTAADVFEHHANDDEKLRDFLGRRLAAQGNRAAAASARRALLKVAPPGFADRYWRLDGS